MSNVAKVSVGKFARILIHGNLMDRRYKYLIVPTGKPCFQSDLPSDVKMVDKPTLTFSGHTIYKLWSSEWPIVSVNESIQIFKSV